MVGDTYWSTGIQVKWDGHGEWTANVQFYDDGFCDNESTEGELHTRYYGDLAQAIDTVKADAERLGIKWNHPAGPPMLYVEQDGEDPDLLPSNWKEIIFEQAYRIGWQPPHVPAGKEPV